MAEQENRRLIRREERISRQQQARRLEILGVARELLSRNGIERFNMEAVAEEGGYSRTSIYRYFSSKEDLVMDLAIETLELRVELYRRVLSFDARPRERAIAFGEVTSLLYPQHILAEVFASTRAVREGTTAERIERLTALEKAQGDMVQQVAVDAVERGDWVLGSDLTVEEALFGLSAMTRGLFERLASPLPPGHIRDPLRLQRSMGWRLLDSLQWRPLSSEWDYAATMRRIHTELFPRELRVTLGLGDRAEPAAVARVGVGAAAGAGGVAAARAGDVAAARAGEAARRS